MINPSLRTFLLTVALFLNISTTQAASPLAQYEVLRGGKGFAFVVRNAGADYCVSTIQQFGSEPGKFTDAAGKPVLLLPGPTFRQEDVQAWMLDEKIGARPFLPYNGNYTLLYGEAVQVIGPGKKIYLGEMQFRLLKYNSRNGERVLSVFSEKTVLPPQLAGAPVCKMDGSAVGVITEVIEEGHRAKMETLCLVNPIERMNEGKPHEVYVARSIETLTVLGGPTYRGVKIVEAKPEGIHITHEGGATVIEPWKLAGPDRRKILAPTIWEAIERDLTEQDLQNMGPILTAKLVLSESALSIANIQKGMVFLTPQSGVAAPKGKEEVQQLWGAVYEAMGKTITNIKSVLDAEEHLATAPEEENLRAVEAGYKRLALTLEDLSIAAADLRGDGTDATRLSATDFVEGNVEAIHVYAISKREPDLKLQREKLSPRKN